MSQPTLTDIAEKTGVSVVTVSKALSGKKGVSEPVRKKIQQAAAELGYRKPEQASPAKRTAVVVAERYLLDQHSLYWKIYQEMAKQTALMGKMLLLEIIPAQTEHAQMLPKVLENGNIDGLLILGNFTRSYMMFLEKASTVPIVFVDAQSPSGTMDCVLTDNYFGGAEMTSYLLSLGHRNIGYLGTFHVTDSIDDRFFGAQKAMFARGLSIPPEWRIDDRSRTDFHMYSSEELVLPEGKLPTAFFCNCDLAAEALIGKLRSMGLSVPGDVSVAGFDHYLPYGPRYMELTTFDTNPADMAARAEYVIRQKIESSSFTNGVSLIRGTFIEGKSTRKIDEPVPFV